MNLPIPAPAGQRVQTLRGTDDVWWTEHKYGIHLYSPQGEEFADALAEEIVI